MAAGDSNEKFNGGAIKPAGQQNNALGNLESFLSENYDFRLNAVVDRTEFRQKDETQFKLLTERDLNTIFRKVRAGGNNECTLSLLKSILYSDFVPLQDPFKTYFTNLPAWDKQTDFIAQLASTVLVADDQRDFWLNCFRKWIVAVVACALNEEDINHHVLVLSGAQGLGKSSWLNNLLPKGLKGYLYSGIVNPNNKDTLINLSENLLINLDELENLNRAELGSLKSLITQSAIRLRKAYGHFNENMVRRASFMGSVNDTEFLTDATGNRRYLCFTTTSIDIDHKLDIDMVYSQAYSMLTDGYQGEKFKWWFDKESIDQINKNNSDYIRVSNEEELLLKYFKVPEDDEELEFMTPVEILAYCEQKEGIRLMDSSSLKRLGQALNKYGFRKKTIGNSKPYKVSFVLDALSTKARVAEKLVP